MLSRADRQEEMFVCLKEQGYTLTYAGTIVIDFIYWIAVDKILRKEGYE